MCASHLHWRRERNQRFKTTKLFQGSHFVGFHREFVDNTLRAVCSCGWSVAVWPEDYHDRPNTDPIEDLQAKASEHLKETLDKETLDANSGHVAGRKPDL